MRKAIRKTVASFLAFAMLVTCVPMEALAAAEPAYLPEQEIDASVLGEGNFILGQIPQP